MNRVWLAGGIFLLTYALIVSDRASHNFGPPGRHGNDHLRCAASRPGLSRGGLECNFPPGRHDDNCQCSKRNWPFPVDRTPSRPVGKR